MNHSWRALLLARSRPVPPRHPVAMWGCTHSSQAGEEPSRDHEVYGLIGEEGFRRLAASFYNRVLLDDVLFPMYASLIFHLSSFIFHLSSLISHRSSFVVLLSL
ncbi:MAG: hypothetical protein Q8P67_03090 [archaeon]|nr:hypothetical protein [archaeon]